MIISTSAISHRCSTRWFALLLLISAATPAVLCADEEDTGSLGRRSLWYEFSTAAFSGDGKTLLTASNHIAQLWDVESGLELRRLTGHSEQIHSANFSPDGKQVVTAAGAVSDHVLMARDMTARVWDVATGREVKCLDAGHGNYLHMALFSPDGKRILTASSDSMVVMWDVETGEQLFRLLKVYSPRVAFNARGTSILVIAAPGKIKLWDAETGGELCSIDGGKRRFFHSAQFSSDGKLILTSVWSDGTAQVWDAVSGRQVRAFDTPPGHLVGAVFSGDGARVATVSDDATARLWDTELGTELRQFRHPQAVKVEASPCELALNSDGKRLLVKWQRNLQPGGDGTTVSLWDVEAARETRQFKLRPQSAIYLFSPDGKRVLTSSDHTTLWDAETGEVIRRYE